MTDPPTQNDSISKAECAALQHLENEWTRGELKMTFMVGYEALELHLQGNCTHKHDC